MPAPTSADSGGSAADELSPRLDRLDALHSAWRVLAADDDDCAEIAETGRALSAYLTKIAESRSDVMPSALRKIDALLSEFEASIRQDALRRPISSLRSTLPRTLECDRRGLLDLLDVLIGDDPYGLSSIDERIGTIDYVVTLLCTARSGDAISHDPVSLTPRMAAFCAACDDAPDDPLRVEVESEFFAASGMETDALRDEIAQRSRRRRKLELGRAYFSPRVLRAIVTYNAALVARIGDELPELMDPDTLAATPGPHRDPQPGSVFRSEPLRQLAAATRRRLDGAAPASGLADRIVALLGLDDLEDQERKALSSPAVGTEEDPLGTAILVGLLSRSVTVLSIELQELGLMADTVSDDWLDELGALFQQEIHRHLANDAYPVACRLSELRNRFLIAASQDARDASDLECGPHGRRNAASSTVAYARASPPAGGPAAQAEGEAPGSRAHAREIMRDALEWQRASRRGDHDRSAASHLPWARLGRATALAAVALVAAIGLLTWRDPGPLDGLGRARLEAVSAHLQSGRLDARAGSGSFVGRIDEAWAALPADRREAVAREIVERLRHQGLQQIMIYDDDGRVRIQALGSQPIRVL